MGRAGGGPEFDLGEVAKAAKLDVSQQGLLAFAKDADGIFGKRHVTMDSIRFTLNAEGHRKAVELDRDNRTFAPVRWLTSETAQKLVNVGNFFVAALALFVAAAAYLKATN